MLNGYWFYGFTGFQFSIYYSQNGDRTDNTVQKFKKKAESIQNEVELNIKDRTNNLLNERVFKPLRNDMIEILDENSPYVLPLVGFDPLDIQKSDDYDEAVKHLEQDIDKFDEHFKEIGNQVADYNNNLLDFEGDGLDIMLSKYFEENGFYSNGRVGILPKRNMIIISNLKDRLKCYWKYNEDFELKMDGDFLRINGKDIIASIDPEDEDRLKDCIIRGKNYQEIVNKYDALKNDFNKIISQSEYLGKEIAEKLVRRIEKGKYDRTCDECKAN